MAANQWCFWATPELRCPFRQLVARRAWFLAISHVDVFRISRLSPCASLQGSAPPPFAVCALVSSYTGTFKSLEKEDAPVEVKKKMQHRAEEQKGTTRNPSTPTDVQALHLRVPHKKDVICWQRLDLGTQIWAITKDLKHPRKTLERGSRMIWPRTCQSTKTFRVSKRHLTDC